MRKSLQIIACLFLSVSVVSAQPVSLIDDFEGNGNITWIGDGAIINTSLSNPFAQGINSSATVMEYHDQGAQYANVRFDAGFEFNLAENYIFTLKVYVPSGGITGAQPNQISLKLQNNNLPAPWSTQTEIIKPIVLDQWQELTFDFLNDPFININGISPPPTQRGDLNRVLIQLNGENNNDQVLAYIDDFNYVDSTPPPPVYDYLVWSDEFNGNVVPDNSKWHHQTLLPAGGSWFNGEIQHYTSRLDNSYLDNGLLKIVAKKETFTDQGVTKQYTSARLNSKFAFTYGRVEVLAKMPFGAGTWPAIWMLGKNINENGAWWDLQGFGTTPWPACGEIDIMEHWGNNQNYISSATHTPSSFGATVNHGGQVIPTASTNFHLYALEWTPEKLVFSVDSVVHWIYNPTVKNDSTWPFDDEQYLILNIAIEPSIDPAFTESSMDIDYIRVYQETPASVRDTEEYSSLTSYPNPAKDIMNIQIPSLQQGSVNVLIHDINGRLRSNTNHELRQGQIALKNLSDLESGMYFISVSAKDRSYRGKFIRD